MGKRRNFIFFTYKTHIGNTQLHRDKIVRTSLSALIHNLMMISTWSCDLLYSGWDEKTESQKLQVSSLDLGCPPQLSITCADCVQKYLDRSNTNLFRVCIIRSRAMRRDNQLKSGKDQLIEANRRILEASLEEKESKDIQNEWEKHICEWNWANVGWKRTDEVAAKTLPYRLTSRRVPRVFNKSLVKTFAPYTKISIERLFSMEIFV